MHDDDVVHFMKADFEHKTLTNCEKFISLAQDSSHNLHLAVADDNNTYMRTVSLKDINDDTAEFAITMRKTAMGKGYATEGMRQILNLGFNDLNLNTIYWCVSKNNHRAVKFYDKNGYTRVSLGQLSEALNTPYSDIITGGGTAKKRFRTTSGTWLQKKILLRNSFERSGQTTKYRKCFCSLWSCCIA